VHTEVVSLPAGYQGVANADKEDKLVVVTALVIGPVLVVVLVLMLVSIGRVIRLVVVAALIIEPVLVVFVPLLIALVSG
jgi:hypothetical protein